MQESGSANNRNFLVLALSGCLLLLISLMCLGTAALTGIYLYDRYGLPVLTQAQTPPAQTIVGAGGALEPAPQPLPQVTLASPLVEQDVWPTATAPAAPTAPPGEAKAGSVGLPQALDQFPVPSGSAAYLERLYLADQPAHDYFDSAMRLGKRDVGTRTIIRPSASVGDRQVFQTTEGPVDATLLAVTEHAYFWFDDRLQVEQDAVDQTASELEERYYGRVNHLFGQPWAPGVDNDPRFSILHLATSGNSFELGFFSDQDEYPQTLFGESNQQEIVYLIMDQLQLGSDLYFGTLVHELQHLFQWNLDKNEATWFNEGLSQLAELYAGLNTAVPDPYLELPAVRLDEWSYDEHMIGAHYAASYLFLAYCWDQLTEAGVYELVRHPANGLAALRSVLQGFLPDRSLEEFMADWAVATFLDDPAAGERYYYARLDIPRPVLETQITQVPYDDLRELEQFAVHYVGLDLAGPHTLTFAGDTTARVIDAPPTSGEQMWYAPPSNDSDAQLSASFDLSAVDRATLTFNAWYDLEDGFDFAYVSVSADQGATWDVLYPQHSQTGNYGPAISGKSANAPDAANGWILETLALNQYAGQHIQLRFHVITDFETTGRGFALDDIAINEIGFFDDVEGGTGSWDARGFVRSGWLLPQQWAVRLIRHGAQPQLIPLTLSPLNQASQPIEFGPEGGTLVIMPQTPFVDDTASYWLQID